MITILATYFIPTGIVLTFATAVGVEVSLSRVVVGVDMASSMFLNVRNEPWTGDPIAIVTNADERTDELLGVLLLGMSEQVNHLQ